MFKTYDRRQRAIQQVWCQGWRTYYFWGQCKRKDIGIREIDNLQSLSIHHVLFVDGLKHNLLSISQLYDMGNKVTFYPKNCFVSSLDEDKVIFSGERLYNVYVIDLNKIDNKDIKCLMSISHDTWTWYRRLEHAIFELLDDLSKHELVVGPNSSSLRTSLVVLVKR